MLNLSIVKLVDKTTTKLNLLVRKRKKIEHKLKLKLRKKYNLMQTYVCLGRVMIRNGYFAVNDEVCTLIVTLTTIRIYLMKSFQGKRKTI